VIVYILLVQSEHWHKIGTIDFSRRTGIQQRKNQGRKLDVFFNQREIKCFPKKFW